MKKIFIILVVVYLIPLMIVGFVAMIVKGATKYDITNSKAILWFTQPLRDMDEAKDWFDTGKKRKI